MITTLHLILIALIVLPFLVRIVSGSDKMALLTIAAVIGYAAHFAGFIRL